MNNASQASAPTATTPVANAHPGDPRCPLSSKNKAPTASRKVNTVRFSPEAIKASTDQYWSTEANRSHQYWTTTEDHWHDARESSDATSDFH